MNIGEINNEFKSISPDDTGSLALFVKKYSNDKRSGVCRLVSKAEGLISKYEKEVQRTGRMYVFEDKYHSEGRKYICGIDEVGRGPLAGPVVACAVILPYDKKLLYLNDSKQVSKKKREELYDIITSEAVTYGIGMAGEQRIDEINILQATYEAMRMAINNLSVRPDILLNDAVRIPGVDIHQVPIIKGDTLSASIAAASIVAKVTRDRLMQEYDSIYPEYGFKDNVGYGSAGHIEAIRRYGPSPIHRRSFIGKFCR